MVTSRIWFTAAQKAELWERWENGQPPRGCLERKNKTGVERIAAPDRGIGSPPRRRALAAHARFQERGEISRGISVGGRPGRSPRASEGAIDSKPGDQAQRRQSGLSCKPG